MEFAPRESLIIGVWQGLKSTTLAANIKRVDHVLPKAAQMRCQILCFPECFLTGYDDPISLDHPCLSYLAEKAAKHGIVLLIGFLERASTGVFITQAVLVNGEITGAYRKAMLSAPEIEIRGIDRGLKFPVFQAGSWCFGIQICHDNKCPDITASLVTQGAEIIFSPGFNLVLPSRVEQHRTRSRFIHAGLAAIFDVIVARSNIISEENSLGRVGYGDSAIFSPVGTIIAEAGLFHENLIVADVSAHLRNESRHERIPEGLLAATYALRREWKS